MAHRYHPKYRVAVGLKADVCLRSLGSMICTFCGGENRAENRFCGICGVRVERRTKERRTNQPGSAKCPSCGHQNEPGYKFCGLCGTGIERRMQDRRATSDEARANALANAQLPPPELAGRKTATLPSEPEIPPAPEPAGKTTRRSPQPGSIFATQEQITPSTSIGGPSFLGLNSEPQSEGDYLLEDESSSRGGLRTLVLLAILAAILGLIFVQWRSSYRANPKSSPVPNPPAQSQPQGSNHPSRPATPNNSNPSPSQAAAAPIVPSQPDSKTAAAPEIADKNDTVASAKTDTAADDQKEEDTGDGKQAASANSKALPPEKAKPSAALIRAQRYLQGRGVPQSCEQGLMYLKAATEENDPRAAVQMGALYSSGYCVQQDRVKAYKWFSTARDLEPQNQWLEKNLNQLWAQMTAEERRRIQ